MNWIKNFLVVATVSGAVFAPSISARAATFTLSVPAADPMMVDPSVNNFIFPGVQSDSSTFNATLSPGPPITFTNSTNVSYGITSIGGGTNNSMDSFSSKLAQFTFDIVDQNGILKHFQVNGVINDVAGNTQIDGSGNGSTGDDFIAQSVQLNGGAPLTTLVTSPNGRESIIIPGVTFANNEVINVYVEHLNALTGPNTGQFLSVGGYVTVAVPEPGSFALAVGMSAVGAAGILRRRRLRRA